MKASIIIPTKNGEQYLGEVLDMVFRQKVDFLYEVIIIDSGSKDKTLEIIERFQKEYSCHSRDLPATLSPWPPRFAWQAGWLARQAGGGNPEDVDKIHLINTPPRSSSQLRRGGLSDFQLYQIPPHEFGHGKTRNFAVSKVDPESEYFVFLTQDAIPAGENWLEKIIEPFEKDPHVAGVFGRHLPRKECDPFQRKTLIEFMNSFGKDTAVYQLTKPDNELTVSERHFLNFFSNVNSAVRRDIFRKIPFREVEMGEDQFWTKDILVAGYKKAYAPAAAVYHSHNYGIWNQFKRWFDEFRQHKINQNYVGVSTILKVPYLTLRLWTNDVKYILRQKDYSLFQKTYWSMWIFFMDFARMCAEYIGGRYDRLPMWLQNKLSMQYEIIHKK